MAFDEQQTEMGAISQINVTPLVDVMLVLLVIFMVAAPILQQGVELELPQATIAPIEGDGEQLVVSITKDGTVIIGERTKISLAEVGKKVKAILDVKDDKRVFIKADHRVQYGTVMKVMAAIRSEGIVKVGLLTEPV